MALLTVGSQPSSHPTSALKKVQIYFDTQNVWSKPPNIFWEQLLFWTKHHFAQHFCLTHSFFGPIVFLDYNFCWTQKVLTHFFDGPKKFWETHVFWTKKFFGLKFLVAPTFLWDPNCFGTQIFVGPKFISNPHFVDIKFLYHSEISKNCNCNPFNVLQLLVGLEPWTLTVATAATLPLSYALKPTSLDLEQLAIQPETLSFHFQRCSLCTGVAPNLIG